MTDSIINNAGAVGSSVINMGPGQSNMEDMIDMAFYGLRQDQTGHAYIDRIMGDSTISLPDQYTQRPDDYKNWIWTYNTLAFSWGTGGRLTMEVL